MLPTTVQTQNPTAWEEPRLRLTLGVLRPFSLKNSPKLQCSVCMDPFGSVSHPVRKGREQCGETGWQLGKRHHRKQQSVQRSPEVPVS